VIVRVVRNCGQRLDDLTPPRFLVVGTLLVPASACTDAEVIVTGRPDCIPFVTIDAMRAPAHEALRSVSYSAC
jgi:hypothetical protein